MENKIKGITSSGLGWRHLQAFLLFLGMAVAYTFRVCMSVAAIAMRNSTSHPEFPEYDWDQSIYTTILGAFFWGYVITQIPVGQLVRTRSAFKILAAGMFIGSTINGLTPWIASVFGYVGVILARIAIGLSQGCLHPCSFALISRWVPPLERSRLSSFVLSGSLIGTIMAMLMSGFLADSKFGWPSIFYFHGAIGVLWSILFYCFSADSPSEHSKIGSKEIEYIKSSLTGINDSADAKKMKVPWKSILSSGPLWSVIIGAGGCNWGFSLFLTQLPSYMKYALNFDVSASGTVSALPYLAMLLLTFPISFLSDYALLKGFSTGFVRKTCAIIGSWIPALCLIVLGCISTSNKFVVVGIIVLSIAFSSGVGCSIAINTLDLSPNFASSVTGFMNTSVNLIGLTGPLVYGLVVTDPSDLEQWRIVLFITAGIYIFTCLIFVIFGRGDVQPWNDPDNQRMKFKSGKTDPEKY